MFKAVWTEVGDGEPVEADGLTKKEALTNLQAKLAAQCQTLGIPCDEDPPLELSNGAIVCGGFTVGHIEMADPTKIPDWLDKQLEDDMKLESLEILAKSDPTLFAEAVKKFGLQVIGTRESDPLKTQVQEELVSAMASAITEDINDNTELTTQQRAIYQLAEQYGYIVQVL